MIPHLEYTITSLAMHALMQSLAGHVLQGKAPPSKEEFDAVIEKLMAMKDAIGFDLLDAG